MKICLVIHSLGIGGMERVMAQLANQFSLKKEVEIHLILIGIRRNIEYELSEKVVVHRPAFEFRNSWRTIDTIRTIRYLRSKVKELEPDTLLSFGEIWNNMVLMALWGLNFPVYVSDRAQADKSHGRLHSFLRSRLYYAATGYIAQTNHAADVCRKKSWNKNVTVICNPVNIVNPGNFTKKKNVVLTVARLIPTKHVDRLIRIFAELNVPGWRLEIIGGDAKRMALSVKYKRLIDELNAGDMISLEGERNDVEQYYRKAKVFAFTSSTEGFPNVIGEALSAGLPVVAYNCVAGPSDLINHGKNGYLVELFDDETFKKYLLELMKDESIRKNMAKNAIQSMKKYHPNIISEKFYQFITSHL